MQTPIKATIASLAALSILLGFFAYGAATRPIEVKMQYPEIDPVLGVGGGDFREYTTVQELTVGKDYPTKVATSSPFRQRLEIHNYSGASSTVPQLMFCNVTLAYSAATVFPSTAGASGVAGLITPFKGFAVHASTTKVFDRSTGVPTGAVYCIMEKSTSTAASLDI